MAMSWYNNGYAGQHNPTGSTHRDGKHKDKIQQPSRHRKSTAEVPCKEARSNKAWPPKPGKLPQGTAAKQSRKTQRRITSVPLSANLSMGMSAIIRAQSLNLLVGFE